MPVDKGRVRGETFSTMTWLVNMLATLCMSVILQSFVEIRSCDVTRNGLASG